MEYVAKHYLKISKSEGIAPGTRITPELVGWSDDEIKRLIEIRAIEGITGAYRSAPELPPFLDKQPINDAIDEEHDQHNELRRATPEEMNRFARLSKEKIIVLAEEHEIYDLSMDDTKNDMVVRLIEAGIEPK